MIANFIGQEYEENPREYEINRCLKNGRIEKPFIDNLNYENSWDWLMPVVQKISQIEGVYEIEEFLLIRDELATARIETVYSTVVDFIKYWNER